MNFYIYKKIFILLAFLFFIVHLLSCGENRSKSVEITTGWQYRPGDSSFINNTPTWIIDKEDNKNWRNIKFPNNPTGNKKNNIVWFRTLMPKLSFENPSLLIPFVYECIEIYINQQKIYSKGEIYSSIKRSIPEFDVHLIPLEKKYEGEYIYLRVFSKHNNIGVWGTIKIGSRYDLIIQSIKDDLHKIIIGIIILLSGFFFLFVFLRDFSRKEYIGLFILSICLGLYTIFYTQSKSFLFNIPSIWNIIWITTTTINPIGILIMLEYIYHPKYFLRIFILVHIIFTIASVIIIGIDINLYIYTRPPLLLLLVLNGFIMLYFSIKGIKSIDLNNKIFGIGTIILLVIACFDFLKAFFGLFPDIMPISYIGMIIFLIINFIIFVQHNFETKKTLDIYSKELRELRKNIEISKKQDERTGLILKDNDDYFSVKFDQIIFLSSHGKYTVIHAEDKDYETYSLLKDILAVLPESDFVRIHKMFIVNVKYIIKMQHYKSGQYLLYLNDEDENTLPVGRNYVQFLKETLITSPKQ